MTMNIKDYVRDLDLSDGEAIRSDCPICNSRNTFTATKNDGTVLYICYKLSCSLATGFVSINLTADEVASRLSELKETYGDLFTYERRKQ